MNHVDSQERMTHGFAGEADRLGVCAVRLTGVPVRLAGKRLREVGVALPLGVVVVDRVRAEGVAPTRAGRAIVAPLLPWRGVAMVARFRDAGEGEVFRSVFSEASNGGGAAGSSCAAFEMIVLFSVRHTAVSPDFRSV